MSTKNILGIEKGIERSISPKRDAVLMSRAHLLQPPQQPEVKPEDTVPMNLDITKLLIRKQEKKRLEKKRIKQKERKEQKEQGGVARIAKKHGSPLSSSSSSVSSISSVSISPNDIIAFEEEQRREATRDHQGSPKSVSPSLSPLGRRASIEEAAEARRKSSSSASASSSSSSSSPRFEKFDSWSMSPTSPKGKGRQGGGSRRRRRTAHKKHKTHHKSKRVHHTRRKHTRRHRHRHR